MKILSPLFLILLLLSTRMGQAQDQVITLKNDTINCKIISAGSRYIRFDVEQNGIVSKKKMNSWEAKGLLYGENKSLAMNRNPLLYRWRISASGGLGYLVGDTDQGRKDAAQQGLTDQEIDDYYKQIMWGWQTGANVHYFVRPDLGIGLNYRLFSSGADVWATFDPQDGVNLYHGKLVENMYVNYVGPSVFSQYFISPNQKLLLTGSYSAGMVFFRDETTMLESNLLMKGKAFGMTATVGLEYLLSSHVALGFDLNAFASNIGKLTVDNGDSSATVNLEDENRQNLSSLDCSVGLRFYF